MSHRLEHSSRRYPLDGDPTPHWHDLPVDDRFVEVGDTSAFRFVSLRALPVERTVLLVVVVLVVDVGVFVTCRVISKTVPEIVSKF